MLVAIKKKKPKKPKKPKQGDMSITVDIDHETGDLSQYTTTSIGGGDLSVTASAALAGTNYGLSCLINDATNLYGRKNFTKQSIIRFRFYIDPNSLTMANTNDFRILWIQQVAGAMSTLNDIILEYTTLNGYGLLFEYYDDLGSGSDRAYITDAPHYVEVNIVRATTDVSSDGTIQWWVDGVSQGSWTGIDNYNLMNDQDMRIWFGAFSGIDAGTSGTLYLDELIINDDGSEIGPYIPPVSGKPKNSMFYERLRQSHVA